MQSPPRPPCWRLAAGDGGQLRFALAIQHRSPLAAAFAPPQGRLQSLQHTTLANLLDVLHGDSYLTRYLGVAPGRPLCSLIRQQQDLCMPAPVRSYRSFLHQRRELLTFCRLQIDNVQLLHYHPSQCDCDGLRYTSTSNRFILRHY